MAIVRKDKLKSGYNGNLESVIIFDANDKKVEVTNGVFVTVGGLLKDTYTNESPSGNVSHEVTIDHREVKKANLTEAGTGREDVLLVHNGEYMYDERLYKLEDYRIPAGKVARAYYLETGDIITLTEDLFSGTVEVGDVLVAGDKGLLTVAGEGSDALVTFTVIEDSGNELSLTEKAFAVQVTRK